MLEIPKEALKDSGMCEHGNWKQCPYCVENESTLMVNEDEQVFLASHALEKSIGVAIPMELIYSKDLKELVGNALLQAVEGLPEKIGETLGLDLSVFSKKAAHIIDGLKLEKEIGLRSEQQLELLYLYLGMIARVQGKTNEAFSPTLAKEKSEMSSTLGCWSLKQKLEASGIKDVSFDFGYTPNQEVGIVKIANGKTLYVDTKTGFVAEIALQEEREETDESSPIPLFRILSAQPLENPETPETHEQFAVPTQIRIQHNGALHWLGNLSLLTNAESPVYATDTATQFRAVVENDAKKSNATRTIIAAAQLHTKQSFTFPQPKTSE